MFLGFQLQTYVIIQLSRFPIRLQIFLFRYLKRGAGFFRILFFFTKKNQFLHWNETDRFQRVLKIFQNFFVQNEAEYSYFINQKFFTPLTRFLPQLFLKIKISKICSVLIVKKSEVKTIEGGKKLLICKVWIYSFILHKKLLKNL